MPQPPKYSDEQKAAVKALFWQGRSRVRYKGENSRGEHTISQIEQITGVSRGTIWKTVKDGYIEQ